MGSRTGLEIERKYLLAGAPAASTSAVAWRTRASVLSSDEPTGV